jgi:DeoR/GlpR family transcriptional regulator of sugar metabolism
MKTEGAVKVTERRDAIAKLVNQQGYASIEQLSEVHGVSTQTIRRDILALSLENLVIRHHGGAGAASSMVNISYNVHRISMLDEKRRLARAAAKLIRPSQSVFLTGGSTMETLAQEIAQFTTLCVITNNIHAAFHLYSKPEIDLLMPCGRVRHHNGGIVGPAAIEFVGNFQADFMFMGIGAVSRDGLLLEYDFDEALLMNRMMANARNRVMVTDSSKFERNALAQVGTLADLTHLVTDREPPARIRRMLTEHKVALVIPPEEDQS